MTSEKKILLPIHEKFDELKELVEFSRNGQLPGIPLTRRPMSEVNEALSDLENGKSVGRIVLTPN